MKCVSQIPFRCIRLDHVGFSATAASPSLARHSRRLGEVSVVLLGKTRIRKIGPVVLVEASGFFESLFVDVEYKVACLRAGILFYVQRLERHGEQFVPHSQKSAEGNGGIADRAG